MSKSVLLRNAMVIDGLGTQPFLGSVLFDRDGIAAVLREPAALPELPANTEIQDISGHFLMPGLIDAHCHITFDEPHNNDELFFHRRPGLAAIIAAHNARKVLQAGVTGFLDADCLFDLGVDLRDAIEAGVVQGPRMRTGGYALLTGVGGTAGRLLPDEGTRGYGVVVRNRDEIVTEVRRQIKHGVDWIKVHVTGLIPRQRHAGEITAWTMDELRAVCDTAHQLGIPVVGHCRNASSVRDAARAGFDLILHATHMDEEALAALVSAHCPIAPSLTFQANLADFGHLINASPELQDIFRREIEDSARMLIRAKEAGVPIICGSESGFALTPYGEWHHRELDICHRYLGMTRLEAIRAGTSEAARALGMYGQTGAIAEGYKADLLVLSGDPSRDLSLLGNTEHLKAIYLDGQLVDRTPVAEERQPISGWRVSSFAERRLTRAMTRQAGEQSP